MCTNRKRFALACMTLAVAAPAFAQKAQPWKHPNGSVESRIQVCPTSPTAPVTPAPRVAFDDFICDNTGPISWLYWWGVVLDPQQQQLNRPFYIAIHGNTQGTCPMMSATEFCNVGPRLAYWCVIPTTKYVGLDCQNRRVYRFRAKLNPVFTQTAGTHYWLTIAEIDQQSARPGIEDFRWSGFRKSTAQPHNHCPAQLLPLAAGACSIVDTCNVPTDLSFDLKRYLIPVIVAVPAVIQTPLVGSVEILPATAPSGSPALVAQTMDIDDDGTCILDEELPDGMYRLRIRVMGSGDYLQPLQMNGGMAPDSFFDVFVGDLNNDGLRNGNDVAPFVQGLLAQ